MGGAQNNDDDAVEGPDDDGPEFSVPLPAEDRLWRHPSELAAESRAAAVGSPSAIVQVTTVRTPWQRAVGLATVGAIGGALVVAGLFLTLGSTSPAAPTASAPVSTLVAFDPVVPVPRSIAAEDWAAEVAERGSDAIVEIHRDGNHEGAGIFFRNDGYILTSKSVVRDSIDVVVRMHDGTLHNGTVIGRDAISGLAAVAIDHQDTPTAPLGIFKEAPQIGDHAVAVPAVVDDMPTDLVPRTLAATSINVPVTENRHLHGLIQLDGPPAPLTDGGPLVDDSGAVIGIVVDMGSDHATHAVPIAYARRVAEDFIDYGVAKHSWLGIKGVDLDSNAAADLGVEGGVRVTSIIEESPADAAGLRKGDVITDFDGQPVLSMTELILELRRNPPGHQVEVRYLRGERAKAIQLTVATRYVDDTT